MTFATTITEQANRIADTHFSGLQRRIVNVYGGVGLGKSTLLASLREVLKARGELPVLVSPTIAEIDTAAEAIVQIFDGLDSYGLLGDAREMVKDPSRPFQDKVDIASEVIRNNSDRVVLLCDELDEWAIRSKQDQLYYVRENSHSRSLAHQVRNEFDCAKVIAERYYLPGEPEFAPINLKPASAYDSQWDLTPFSNELAYLLLHPPFLKSKQSFLKLRLLSALHSLGDNEVFMDWSDDNVLAIHFVKFFRIHYAKTPLLNLVAKLALVRGEISEKLLEHLGINRGLSDLDQQLIHHAFLSSIGSNVFSMHPLLRSVIANAGLLTPQETMRAHAQIAEFQMDYLDALRTQNRAALLVEYRGYDQCAKAGMASIERVSHFFVAQLHVWGRCLSRDLKLHERAAEVFGLAIKEDSRDDYGHHYKAYNLDYIAKDEQASELHYRTAVELNPLHPWYWSRWINFLITTGRMKEARDEWVIAGNALSAPDNCEDETFYHLHFWVAQLLVHRAQLDFARQILDEVPDRVRKNQSQFIELYQLLNVLLIARDERAVFPAYIVPDDYWSVYPHLGQPIQWNGQSLTSFFSARVEEWRETEVDLVVGKQEDGDIRYGQVTFTHEELSLIHI